MKKPSPRPARAPVGRKAVSKAKRAKVTIEPAQNLVVDENDDAAIAAVARATARSMAPPRARIRRSAVERIDDPPPLSDMESSLVVRVSHAIERELSKIETIIGGARMLAPVTRSETESRARVLASLARTLKEVMRLREQERAATRATVKAADDDMPRDLDELRSELARRLAILVGEAKTLHPDAAE